MVTRYPSLYPTPREKHLEQQQAAFWYFSNDYPDLSEYRIVDRFFGIDRGRHS